MAGGGYRAVTKALSAAALLACLLVGRARSEPEIGVPAAPLGPSKAPKHHSTPEYLRVPGDTRTSWPL